MKGGASEPRGPGPNCCNARISTSLCLSSWVLAEGSASLKRRDMAHATGGGARPRPVKPSPRWGDHGEVHLTLAFEQRLHSQTAPTPKSRRYQDEEFSWDGRHRSHCRFLPWYCPDRGSTQGWPACEVTFIPATASPACPDASAGDVAVVNPRNFAERYVALWNEPDPDARRAMVRTLRAPGGEHILEPPDDLGERPARSGFEAPTLEVRGYAAIEALAASRTRTSLRRASTCSGRVTTRPSRATSRSSTGRWPRLPRARWRAPGSRCSCWTIRAAS